MKKLVKISPLLAVLLLGACATVPEGPSVMSLPGTGKTFDDFRADDMVCRQYAQEQTGTDPNKASTDAGVKTAALTTVVGAAIGALADGNRGAGSGAAMGLMMGSAVGAGTGQSSGMSVQRRYDNAYVQCMYAKGNKVPVSGQLQSAPAPVSGAPVAPSAGTLYPPPPPNR